MQWKVDFIQQPAMISSVAGLRWSAKALLTAKLAPKKKRSWSLFGVLLPILSTAAFWILAKPLHLRSMLSKSMRYTKNGNACSQQLVNTEGPILLHSNSWPHVIQPTLEKLKKLGYKVLPHPPYSPDLLPTNFCKHLNSFLQGKCFHNQQEAENASQEFIESQSMDFYATGINNLISHWQKCVDRNVSYFD